MKDKLLTEAMKYIQKTEQEDAAFNECASYCYRVYTSYLNAGFDKEQAFELMKLTIITSINNSRLSV